MKNAGLGMMYDETFYIVIIYFSNEYILFGEKIINILTFLGIIIADL